MKKNQILTGIWSSVKLCDRTSCWHRSKCV